MRNSHIACVAGTNEGLHALVRWCTGWIHGIWTAEEAQIWTAALILPLAKGAASEEIKLRQLR